LKERIGLDKKEIVLINKGKSKLTVNFQGAFPVNKVAPKGGKMYLSEREYEWVQANYPHILEGKNQRLYLENEVPVEPEYMNDEDFFGQHHTKVKSAIASMETEEVEKRYRFAQLQENFPKGILKAIEDRILELDTKE
jgi:hypothetical protein